MKAYLPPRAPVFSLAGDDSAAKASQYQVKILTSMLGGGYEAGVSDSLLTPVRGAAIRGSLRWAWRLTRGAGFSTVAELRTAEDRVWGSTNKKSKISVEVLSAQISPGVDAVREVNGRKDFEQPAYALFVAQSETIRKIHKSGNFELQITFPEAMRVEVEPALKAWLWFSGLGSRTRRGLGALFCPTLPPSTSLKLPGMAAAATGDVKWPQLSGASYVLGPRSNSATEAWIKAIELYKSYRQNRRPGQTSNRPGRSYWPEPDAIRRLRNQSAPEHRTPVSTDDLFARAEAGLPLIFRFKSYGDPMDNTLELGEEDSDRMASPLIIKPLIVGEREAYPLILALRTPPLPETLVLKQAGAPDLRVRQGGVPMIEYFLQTAEKAWNTKRRVVLS